jgi:hypothetical protein
MRLTYVGVCMMFTEKTGEDCMAELPKFIATLGKTT